MSSSAESPVDPRLLRALGHPDRYRIVVALCEAPASADDLVALLRLDVVAVRWHLDELVADDAVEAVDAPGDEPSRTRYRSMIRPFLDDAHWEALPPGQRSDILALTLRDVAERIDEGLASGGFGHAQTHVSFTRLLLDEEGWQQVTDLLAGALEEIMEIEAECAERRAKREPGAVLPTSLAMLHFGRPDGRFRRTDESIDSEEA